MGHYVLEQVHNVCLLRMVFFGVSQQISHGIRIHGRLFGWGGIQDREADKGKQQFLQLSGGTRVEYFISKVFYGYPFLFELGILGFHQVR